MCFVVQNHLGKGARGAPPLHPPGRGSVRGSTPCQSQQNVSPFNHSRETSLSLHPSILSGGSGAIVPLETHSHRLAVASPIRGAFLLPRYPHDHFMETTSSRPQKGAFALPFLGTIPSSRRLRAPCIPDQPWADWMPPSCRRWDALNGKPSIRAANMDMVPSGAR